MMDSVSVFYSALFQTILSSKEDGQMAMRPSSGVGLVTHRNSISSLGPVGQGLVWYHGTREKWIWGWSDVEMY